MNYLRHLIVILVLTWSGLHPAQAGAVQTKLDLRVLYVGGISNDATIPGLTTGGVAQKVRSADFREFLDRHFVSVNTCTGGEFTEALAAQADVIVVDDVITGLPAQFSRPMVLIAMQGVRTAEQRGSKLIYDCPCLTEKLSTLRIDHPIFKGPLPVAPTLVDGVDPITRLPVRAWKVHEPVATDAGGMVTYRPYLLEAADSEIISGGINGKGEKGVALAREANLFFWGPAGYPGIMTEEARRTFINTIAYMKQFDGAKQTVRRNVRRRDQLEKFIAYYSTQASRENFLTWFPPAFSSRMVRQFGVDPARYRAAFADTGFVWVPPGDSWYEVDEEAKSIGVPNNDLRFLQKLIGLLDRPTEVRNARRLLERYTGLQFADRNAWSQWFEAHRGALYFSDNFGYRFFAGPAGPAPLEQSVRGVLAGLPGASPGDIAPVAVSAAIVSTRDRVEDAAYGGDPVGEQFTFVVRLRVGAGWHIYESVLAGDSMQPTQVQVTLPPGARWAGDWHATPGTKAASNTGEVHQTGDVVYQRPFYFTEYAFDEASTDISIRGLARYQACNMERCLPPQDAAFEARLVVAPRNY